MAARKCPHSKRRRGGHLRGVPAAPDDRRRRMTWAAFGPRLSTAPSGYPVRDAAGMYVAIRGHGRGSTRGRKHQFRPEAVDRCRRRLSFGRQPRDSGRPLSASRREDPQRWRTSGRPWRASGAGTSSGHSHRPGRTTRGAEHPPWRRYRDRAAIPPHPSNSSVRATSVRRASGLGREPVGAADYRRRQARKAAGETTRLRALSTMMLPAGAPE